MNSYTLDSVAVLRYAVGALPGPVRTVLGQAGAGTAELQVPSIVVSETMYVAEATQSLKGQTLTMDATDVIDVVRGQMNAKIVPTTRSELQELPDRIDTWPRQLHDAMVVASHVARGTDAVVTSDSKIAGNCPTIWA